MSAVRGFKGKIYTTLKDGAEVELASAEPEPVYDGSVDASVKSVLSQTRTVTVDVPDLWDKHKRSDEEG